MKVLYDRETDTLTIVFSQAPIAESDEVKPGYIFDWDEEGNLVSVEVLSASRRLEKPAEVHFSLSEKSEAQV